MFEKLKRLKTFGNHQFDPHKDSLHISECCIENRQTSRHFQHFPYFVIYRCSSLLVTEWIFFCLMQFTEERLALSFSCLIDYQTFTWIYAWCMKTYITKIREMYMFPCIWTIWISIPRYVSEVLTASIAGLLKRLTVSTTIHDATSQKI